jgi:hypothetical protein
LKSLLLPGNSTAQLCGIIQLRQLVSRTATTTPSVRLHPLVQYPQQQQQQLEDQLQPCNSQAKGAAHLTLSAHPQQQQQPEDQLQPCNSQAKGAAHLTLSAHPQQQQQLKDQLQPCNSQAKGAAHLTLSAHPQQQQQQLLEA